MKYRPPGRYRRYRPPPVPCRGRGHRISAARPPAIERRSAHYRILPPRAPAGIAATCSTQTVAAWCVFRLSLTPCLGWPRRAAPARSRSQGTETAAVGWPARLPPASVPQVAARAVEEALVRALESGFVGYG